MNWYYLNDAGEVAGPVSDSTLEKLRAMNRLADNAQVCREGSEDWISLAEALGTFTATPAGGSESVVPSAARTVVNTLPQSHQTPGSQLNVQHAARQVRFKGGGTTRQATPPRSTGKKRTLILSAIGVLAAVIVGVVFVTSKQDWKANFSDAEWTEKTFSEALEIDKLQQRNVDAKLRYFAPNSKNPVTGWVKEIDKTSGTRELFHVKSGIRDGAWAAFFKSGQLQVRGTFKEGKSRGTRESWYKNGQKESEWLIEDTDLLVKKWKPNGEVCPESRVEGGNGKEINYGDDGKPSSIMFHENGKLILSRGDKKDKELDDLLARAQAIVDSPKPKNYASGRQDNSIPTERNQDHFSSPDFEMGFRAGAIRADLPFTNRDAYLAGRRFGEQAKSMPAYTQGYNQGREHGLQKISMRSNPFNTISQKVEWLAWDQGYTIGNSEVGLSRALQGR